jgi:hypothetical protein
MSRPAVRGCRMSQMPTIIASLALLVLATGLRTCNGQVAAISCTGANVRYADSTLPLLMGGVMESCKEGCQPRNDKWYARADHAASSNSSSSSSILNNCSSKVAHTHNALVQGTTRHCQFDRLWSHDHCKSIACEITNRDPASTTIRKCAESQTRSVVSHLIHDGHKAMLS